MHVAVPTSGIQHDASDLDVPALRMLISKLSEDFDITVYSTILRNRYTKSFKCGHATVRFVAALYNEQLPKRIVHFLRAFRKDHLKHPYDIAHGFWALPGGLAAVLAGKLFGLPAIVSLQGGEAARLPQIAYGNMRKQPLKGLTLWTCRNADILTCLTNFQLDQLRRYLVNRSSHRVVIVPFGANKSFDVEKKRSIPVPPFHFLHVANLNMVKDQIMLLKTFQLIARRVECTLRVIGEDQMDGAIELLSQKMQITDRIEFLGYVPHEDLPTHYLWAHAILHTSSYEGQGVVIAEAAAAQVLICGTRVGLISDLGESCTISVEVGDHVGLAKKVLALLENPELLRTLRSNSYSWTTKHNADWTAGRFEKLYHHMVLGNRVPQPRRNELLVSD